MAPRLYCVPRASRVDGASLEDAESSDLATPVDLAEVDFGDEKALKTGTAAEAREKGSHFQRKVEQLNRRVSKMYRWDAKPIRLEVDRANLFHDSFRSLQKVRTPDQLRAPLQVTFKKEEGRDDGGLTRHWFMLISREIVNPEYAMFTAVGKNGSYQINPGSKVQPHFLEYFRFVGRICGKAVWDGFLVESHFSVNIFKFLLLREDSIGLEDMGLVDSVFATSLQWLLDNDVEPLDLNFVIDEEEFGACFQVPLKQGGEDILLTNENKEEYVRLSCSQRLVTSIRPQLDALRGGFYDVISADVLTCFTEVELELLLCGLPVIDIIEWKANCEYKAGYAEDSEVICWLWELLEDWDQEMRARLLQFVTGTSKVPTAGFSALFGANGPRKFQIIRVSDCTRLPQANTCFNELLLPPYPTKEYLASSLAMALYDGGDGFGLR